MVLITESEIAFKYRCHFMWLIWTVFRFFRVLLVLILSLHHFGGFTFFIYTLLGCSCCVDVIQSAKWKEIFFLFYFDTKQNKTKAKIKRRKISTFSYKMLLINENNNKIVLRVSSSIHIATHTHSHTHQLWTVFTQHFLFLRRKIIMIMINSQAAIAHTLSVLHSTPFFPDLFFPSYINKRKKWLNRDLTLNIYFWTATVFF